MTEETDAPTAEESTRADVALKLGKKLFELVRPEAVALGGALLDKGVRAVMDGDIKIRVGAGPAPGTRKRRQAAEPEEVEPEEVVEEDDGVIDAEFTVADGPGPDGSSVESDTAAGSINIEPEPEPSKSRVPHTDGPILGATPTPKKMRYRCQHCSGTWSEVKVLEKCPRCGEPDWRDGDPEEV